MLQANPNLGWRDVQMILMTTAEENDPTDPDWTNNAAGFPVNHNYGFGRVDAQAAVNAAINWQTLPAEVGVASSLRNPNLPIPDNDSNGVSDSVQFTQAINIEFVEIYFSSDHAWWGDLEIELQSPGGTTSLLAEQHDNGFEGTYNNWRFGSARHLGESSQGLWTLTVKDPVPGDTGTFQSWQLKIFGTAGIPTTSTTSSTTH